MSYYLRNWEGGLVGIQVYLMLFPKVWQQDRLPPVSDVRYSSCLISYIDYISFRHKVVPFLISDIELISFRHKAIVSDFNVTHIRHKSIDTIKKERVDNFCRCMCGIKLGNRNMILIMHVGHKYFMLDISL